MANQTPTLSYDAFRLQCGENTAAIFRIYGMPEFPGHVLGVLMASAEPMTLGELTELLGAAKSTVSVAARRLEAFGAVVKTRVRGDRRDHYQAQDDMGALGEHLLKRFLLPEMQAGVLMLNEMQSALDAGRGDDWPEGPQRQVLEQRVQALSLFTHGTAGFLSSLVQADGSLDQARIAQLIGLLSQLQEQA